MNILKILSIILFFQVFSVQSQEKQIFKRSDYTHLLSSPKHYSCDSLRLTLQAKCWFSRQPLADNSQCNCHISISQNTNVFDSRSCKDVSVWKIYYFVENKVFVGYKDGDDWIKHPRFTQTPNNIVAKLFDENTKKTIYISNVGSIKSGVVD